MPSRSQPNDGNTLFGVADDHEVVDESFIGTYRVHATTEGTSAACPAD